MHIRFQPHVDDVVRAVLRTAAGRLQHLVSITVVIGEATTGEAFAASVRASLAAAGARWVDVIVREGPGTAGLLCLEYAR